MATTTPVPVQTNVLVTAFDMLENFNWAQIGDAIKSAETNPVAAVEQVAGIMVQAATVAGVPFAGSIGAMLPVAENLFGFIQHFLPAFGGAAGAAAKTSTAISSPATLTPAVLVTPPVGTAGVKPTGLV